MTVLVISSLADPHARAVMKALAARGVPVELLDLAEYPRKLTLTIAFGSGARGFRIKRPGRGELDLASVHAVWWRRPGAFVLPETLQDPVHRRLALSEASTAFNGLFASLNAFWINPIACNSMGAHKPYQLAVAQSLGLEIPQTLMTSDPEEARAFWDACDGDVVYKQFVGFPEAWSETRRLGRAEVNAPDAMIRIAPVIFQRRVAAVADVRVTIVRDDLFAAAVNVRDLAYDIDVRVNPDARHTAHQLPQEVADTLRSLVRQLGLVYGAIDLRLTAEGRYVFLEINPAGQFLYVEQETGQPITAALVSCLREGR